MPADFYVVGGSWHGNQTVWRMIYDLNLVLQRADRQGRLQPTLQRETVTIVDGLVAGEGDGPSEGTARATPTCCWPAAIRSRSIPHWPG